MSKLRLGYGINENQSVNYSLYYFAKINGIKFDEHLRNHKAS